MFCSNCGTKNDDASKFCKKCGSLLDDAGGEHTTAAPENGSSAEEPINPNPAAAPENRNSAEAPINRNPTAAPANPNPNPAAGQSPASKRPKADITRLIGKAKKLPKKLLLAVVAAAVAVTVVVCAAGSIRRTINLDEYITVAAEGYDGYGTARVSIDWGAIEEKYGERISYTKAAKDEYGRKADTVNPVEKLREFVSVSLDRSYDLSNGDAVAYTWRISEELGTYLKCKVKYSDGVYEVAGLDEVGEFDAFEGLTVSFSGISPDGYASINYNGSKMSSYEFECDKTGGLRNGDTVTVSISEDVEYYVESFGAVPDSFRKEFEVSGLDEYVESYADLPDEFKNKLKSEAEDAVYAYTAGSYDSSNSLTDLAYAGYIIQTVKDGEEFWDYPNCIHVIYSGTVSNSEGRFSTLKVYYPVKFSGILKSGGEFSYERNDGIGGESVFGGSWYRTKGYVNPYSCYMEIVETGMDLYNAEGGDGFEAYAEYETIETLDDISDEYKEQLYADARDRVESSIANDYYEDMKTSELVLAGEYLLTAKTQGRNFGENNKYFVVYSTTITSKKGQFEPTTVYFPVEYDGIVKLPGDEYMMTEAMGIHGRSDVADGVIYRTAGYVDGTEMYTQVINANREIYKYEVSEGLKQFGQ